MASDLFLHSDIVLPSDIEMEFFSDCFSPFSDSPIDVLQAFSDQGPNHANPIEKSLSLDQISSSLLSISPPSQQLQSLSLYQATRSQIFAKTSNFENGYADFSPILGSEAKGEECNFNFEPVYDQHQPFAPHSYNGDENVARYLQRSFSSGSFDGKPGFLFQPCFDALMESADFQNPSEKSPKSSFFTGQMRRVCSTGDLQNLPTVRSNQRSYSSPLASESSLMEEANFKLGRYSSEERRERISKYKAKRTQRNFNKTIKYACRKTLADNRPRIRGRFARNDETGETPKAACSTREEDEDELWIEGWHGEEEDRACTCMAMAACSSSITGGKEVEDDHHFFFFFLGFLFSPLH